MNKDTTRIELGMVSNHRTIYKSVKGAAMIQGEPEWASYSWTPRPCIHAVCPWVRIIRTYIQLHIIDSITLRVYLWNERIMRWRGILFWFFSKPTNYILWCWCDTFFFAKKEKIMNWGSSMELEDFDILYERSSNAKFVAWKKSKCRESYRFAGWIWHLSRLRLDQWKDISGVINWWR